MDNELINDPILKSQAFTEMCNTMGWKYVLTYIQQKISQFTNTALMTGFKDMEEYRELKGGVNSLRSLLAEIESIQQYAEQHKNEETNGQQPIGSEVS